MADLLMPTMPFQVGDWLAEPMANQVVRGDEVCRVEPKVMEVLVCMARRPGRTVTREQFMDEVWAGTVVTDDVLARCISELRKALGDQARDPAYVQTIRKRGYRLIAPVQPVERKPVTAFTSPETASPEAASSEAASPETALSEAASAHELPAEPASPAEAGGLTAPPPVRLPPASVRPPSPTRAAGRRRRSRMRFLLALVALSLAVVAVQQYIAARTRPLATIPVTSFPGEEMDPALSPDGRSVAFTWDNGRGYNFDLYVQMAVGEEPRQLTDGEADEYSPAWSPDGARLAFARCAEAGCTVLVMDVEDGREREVVDLPGFYVRDLVWSPDGRTLALSARKGTNGSHGLLLLPLDTRELLRLTESAASAPGDLDPAWSPDGARLAFVRTTMDGRQDVCVVPVAGGAVVWLAREQQGITGLDWVADGRAVVYAANRDGASGLWRVGLAGGEPDWVAVGDGGEVYQPSTARQARGITFAQRRYETNIAEVVRENGRVRPPAPLIASTRWDSQPDVSPDGERIAFVSNRSGQLEVWTADPDGTNLRRRTSFGGPRVSTPQWSPDGSQIVFSARVNGHADLYLVEPGSPPRRLTDHPGDEVAPSWSRDGRSVYFASRRNGGWQIWKQALAGGDSVPVTRHGGIAAEESPDGQSLLVVRPDRRGLWRIALDRDPYYAEGLVRLNPADWANWVVRDEGVYVVQRHEEGEGVDLVLVDLATKERQWMATVESLPDHPSLAVFPGGRRFLVTQERRSDSDIVLVQDFR